MLHSEKPTDTNGRTLLRFVTTGSVDDGKSTLIGRLLFETHAIFEDQYEAIENYSKRKGRTETDLSLLLDGLAAEREQGITIDVAYRYFSTAKRSFIIADSPGHEQYTRNMVSGASTADLAIILIDAVNGVLTQSKRHGFIISLLQIPHLIVAVNKMDLVDYSQSVFDTIVKEYSRFSEKLSISDITFIPVSALKGDNIVIRSQAMPWYEGNTLLHILENVHVSGSKNLVDFRFPVQYVIRQNVHFRGYAGKISSGVIRANEEVAILPSGKTSHIQSIISPDGEINEAFAGQSVALTLTDDVDVSRGCMLVRKHNLPQVHTRFEAILCWLDEKQSVSAYHYILKHTTQSVKAFIPEILYTIDMNTLHRQPSGFLRQNEIGRVEISTLEPIMFDPYRINRATGSFILIDALTNRNAAAGIIRGIKQSIGDITDKQHAHTYKSPNVTWSEGFLDRAQWEKRHGHKAVVLWFTGLPSSGKTTLARILEKELFDQGCQVMLLDGDRVRHGLCGDLNFSPEHRAENIRRVGETAKLFFEQGNIVLCAFISPFRQDRKFVRSILPDGRFIEIYVRCDISICKARDPKGLYQKAQKGELTDFTGISSSYEEPENPEFVVPTDTLSIDLCLQSIKKYLTEFKLFNI